jgi:hypothetical protein
LVAKKLRRKMTKEEWEAECGFHDKEEYLVSAIKRLLLTDEQRDKMHRLDLLNGRYPYEQSENVQRWFYDPWNAKLGWEEFNAII